MKRLLPFENVTYKTELSPTEIANQLRSSTQYTTLGKSISEKGFTIKRIINYRNSFLPIVTGTITEEEKEKEKENETTVNVKMKMNILVIIFMTFWFAMVFLACFATIAISYSSGFEVFYLIPFGMLIFGVLLVVGGFKAESSKTKKDLQKILQAQIVSCKKESY
ncbi:hypothetical protein [Dysgonomonas sp. BGC7]|uniref:hypothetical protein n=1 Tax=Dysgonomonas sp. BGC7 TaxID=1658008 RepID=UPI00068278AD|nr:hypothetical protein [Dysgonomonas sp. BGC7]MBD8388314.1 hypothetical protein [Dysgonomonas sp. BGC7]